MLSALDTAYLHCEAIARKQVENFPVASLFLKKSLRKAIVVIYAFARTADDIADEGIHSEAFRLNFLNDYSNKLTSLATIEPQDPIFLALKDVIQKHTLPLDPFSHLLVAFKQDVKQREFADFNDIEVYCQHSANPVGRLLLHLTHNASADNIFYSDKICTALQLINFIQDWVSDLTIRNRCYIPVNELARFDLDKTQLQTICQQANPLNASNTLSPDRLRSLQGLFTQQLERAETWFEQGFPLGQQLTGLFGLEIRLICCAGKKMIQLLKQRDNPFIRPTLKKWHYPKLLLEAL